jgi:hypothetical protein
VVTLPAAAVAALAGLPQRTGVVFRPARKGRRDITHPGYRRSGDRGGGQIKMAWARMSRDAALPGDGIERKRYDRAVEAKRSARCTSRTPAATPGRPGITPSTATC